MSSVTRLAVAALASANTTNGTARNGANLATNLADAGGIAVECVSSITTSSVLATFKLQVSRDNTTWIDVDGKSFATDAGTGSAVTTRRVLTFDAAAHAHDFVRVVATLSGASTNTADVTSATYVYVPAGRLYRR